LLLVLALDKAPDEPAVLHCTDVGKVSYSGVKAQATTPLPAEKKQCTRPKTKMK
jgi:hypothetical protein